ncbi:MAG: L,D-transpeptidase family protein [Hyphomicrobiaceae bacterium]|nr:L,D-transpeptidase family protein [Hyphomicrobiaceae bacterium]
MWKIWIAVVVCLQAGASMGAAHAEAQSGADAPVVPAAVIVDPQGRDGLAPPVANDVREAFADGAIADAIMAMIAERAPDADAGESIDRAALEVFYRARNGAPLWVSDEGPSERARALAGEIANAAAFGLDPAAFPLPDFAQVSGPQALGRADYALSMAALGYARHARGGRIPEPAKMLNSNLDRKPQLHEPADVLVRLAAAEDMAGALAALHPVHPQFELLRQAWLKETGGDGRGPLATNARRLRANMEFWRWMWDDLGELHVFNNIPEFMQRVYLNGKIVRYERIVVGEIGKQSSVYSRQLKSVSLRPRWRVPESIMVHELWPSLIRGGGLMRQHGLEIATKSGEPRDWRKIDWSKDDIRNYLVFQPPGGKSALGFVKFNFPSQHTIFMHDTPDKWMFNKPQRTLSHGCLRLKNPLHLTEIVLDYAKGWDKAKVKDLIDRGPLDNEIEIEKRLPIHLAYFTAWADDDGSVRYFNDIYGHEKRVIQALGGEWSKINKGRDHLAKPVPRFNPEKLARSAPAQRETTGDNAGDILSNVFKLGF